MRKQEDRESGCIPACALDVMERLVPRVNLPSEAEMLDAMSEVPDRPGFDQLAHAVEKLELPFTVVVCNGASASRVRAEVGKHPLVCVDRAKPCGTSLRVHCWVLESHVTCAVCGVPMSGFHYSDPDPDQEGGPEFCTDATFEEKWTGDYALIEQRPAASVRPADRRSST